MARRLYRSALPIALVALLIGSSVQPAASGPVPPDPPAIESVSGAGFWGRAACLGCGITIVGVAGATLGGMYNLIGFWPDLYSGCAAICMLAF